MSQPTLQVLQPEQNSNKQTWIISPGSAGAPALTGTIRVPGDKSISHRALMLGALSEGQTVIEGLLLGADPQSTAHCFRAMGA
ncbi:MAG: 3-phosphoshikimate 1-carboxyvinyltransferase, partial [Cyanobacteria bacterium P01_F01_bin.42]